jgi:hypothetical protein
LNLLEENFYIPWEYPLTGSQFFVGLEVITTKSCGNIECGSGV